MKKIIVVLICIVLFLAGGFLCWRYFDDNFRDYYAYAQFETNGDSELFFLNNAFVQKDSLGITVYRTDDEGNIAELYSESMTDRNVKYAENDYFILADENKSSAYYVKDEFTASFEVEGKLLSVHEFGEYICLKTANEEGKVILYRYHASEGLVNLTEKYNFDFVDYCIDALRNKEYFISYVLMGEYVKINIVSCVNGVVSPNAFIEIDNTVYNGFDYVNNMFVFYTDTSMLFINAETQMRSVQYVYDMNKIQKLLYSDKIVYIMDDAYFNGVSNVYIASASSSSYDKMLEHENINKYSDKIIYKTGKYVKQYVFGSALLNDTVLFSDEEIQGLYTMGDKIVVEKSNKLVFMKTNG